MTDQTNDPDQLLTIKQTAKLLGVSPRSVWRLIDQKKLRKRRILGATRIKRKDVDDFSDES